MIAAANRLDMTIPRSWLFAFFIGVFAFASIANFPASLLWGNLNTNGWSIQNISGTIWSAEINGANFAGDYWPELKLAVIKAPLFTGSLKTSFDARGRNKHISGIAEVGNDEEILLTSFVGSMPVYFAQDGVSYSLLLSIRSDMIELDRNGLCTVGQFDITAEFPNPFLVKLAIEMPPFKGLGRCQNGQITAFTSSSRDGFELTLKAEIASGKQIVTIDMVLPDVTANNINVINELTGNGFIKTASSWQLITEISQ